MIKRNLKLVKSIRGLGLSEKIGASVNFVGKEAKRNIVVVVCGSKLVSQLNSGTSSCNSFLHRM